MQNPDTPFWFKQRQSKIEPAGEGVFKLTAPNLDAAYITIRKDDNGLWSARLLQQPDGPETDATRPIYDNLMDAWGAAFELYRVNLVA